MERNNKGQFLKGQIPHNKKSEEELNISKERWRENTRNWHKNNKERVNAQRKRKRLENPSFRISGNLRKRLSFLLKKSSTSKTSQTMSLLGCDMEFFMRHLESKFTEGMSFSNYGKWHIDHIIPCANFNMENKDHQKECFHYTNLQPLWAIDNLRKNKF